MRCPRCEGRKSLPLNFAVTEVAEMAEIEKHWWELVPCDLCHGTGEVPQPAAGPWKPMKGVPIGVKVILLTKAGNVESVTFSEHGARHADFHYTHYSRVNLPGGDVAE